MPLPVVSRFSACLWLAAAMQVAAETPAPLVYTVQPVYADGKVQAVAVELSFEARGTGETTLELPNQWGGEERLYEALSDLSIHGQGASIAPGVHPQQRVIRHAPNAKLRLSYRVRHADEGPTRDGNPYRPIVLPQRIQLLGATVFAAPAGIADDHPVQLRFQDFPKSWALVSDAQRKPLTFMDLMDSVTVAGDFRVLTRQVRGAPLRIAMHGQWPFTDAFFADTLAAISAAQYDFWREPAQPYVVTLLQIDGPTSGGGTGRGAGFAMFATPDMNPRDMIRALAHEMLHHWIPRRLGQLPDGQQDQALEYWLSEGFADYYTLRMLASAGVWSPREVLEGLNVVLRRYAGSPALDAPNARIAAEFWTDSNVRQLPYDRGMLFATMLDAKLRRASNGTRSLDDVMRAMRSRFDGSPEPIRDAFIAAMAGEGLDVRRDLAEFVDAGARITLESDIYLPCGSLVSERIPTFHRGFDADATLKNGMRITGVDPELPAYDAGMRDGMTLLARETGVIGDAMQEIAYRVRDQGVERVLRYLPKGRDLAQTQTLVPRTAPDSDAISGCARRLGAAHPVR